MSFFLTISLFCVVVEDKEALSLDRYYANLPDEYIYGHCSVQPNPANQDLKDFIWGSIDLRQSVSVWLRVCVCVCDGVCVCVRERGCVCDAVCV